MTRDPACFWTNYYRATAKALLPGMDEAVGMRSPYLHDVLMLCRRGAWELELRQFLPPASLVRSLASLLELGLIERFDVPPRHSSTYVPGAAQSGRNRREPSLAGA